MFKPLPPVPDHPALEEEVLAWWEERQTFNRLREQNADGPVWSFVDGPVTANKMLGVHTAWGRTLKDVFQRYKGLRGFHQRYQNGFDCQGLWIEVGVERELGLNSKHEIEEYGLAEFSRRCREKVVWSAGEITRGCVRLGQWMDWGNDYFTFSDTNIEYIWGFLKRMHEQGYLYLGHRSTEWCPRCGTSISAHELVGSYENRIDPSLFVRLPLTDRPGEALAVWTTTPWTLPANVAAAVHPEEEYGRRENGEWVAVRRHPEEELEDRHPGSDLVGWRYEGPFDHLPAAAGVEHRVIPWDDVSMDEGTGIVHIAPGCGSEDFELSRVNDLAVLTPVDEAGRFYPDYGWLHGLGTAEAADQLLADLAERGRLIDAGTIEHRFPFCWRCHTPLIFRISDDWFIAVEELRPKLIDANATIQWTPEYFGKRMDDWLRNLGDWNISRRRFFGLPLPFYPCGECGHLTVVGSKGELSEKSIGGMEQLEELHRPWVDEVTIRCDGCGAEGVRRVVEVGDVWLDAGIVPFSTLGWENPEFIEGGYATGASKGLSTADLPDHEHWETWFPADWVTEMREQIRLWFYSQLFMSVALVGKAPFKSALGYEKMLDEHGREMHGSWGNLIPAEDAFSRMGADVMRWQFCTQPPDRNLLFGYGPAHEIKRRLLTLWNSVRFLCDYGNIEGFEPRYADLSGLEDVELTLLDRWLLARTDALVAETTEAYEAQLSYRVVEGFEAFVDDLSNWYIRRSRRRFYDYDDAAFRTLWTALVQSLRVIAPIMPFLSEHLWQALVAERCSDASESVHLAGWPEVRTSDAELLGGMAEARAVAELGRRARDQAGLKLRQPLGRAVVQGAARAGEHADTIRDELRVKEIEFGQVDATELRVKPNLPVLGPRLGKELGAIRAALAAGEFEELDGGGFRVGGHDLAADDVLVERVGREGWAVESQDGVTVAIDTELDDDLRLEGRVLDLIHAVNLMRKEAGLEVTDRIVLTVPADDDLLRHADWIKAETLAERLEPGGELAVAKA